MRYETILGKKDPQGQYFPRMCVKGGNNDTCAMNRHFALFLVLALGGGAAAQSADTALAPVSTQIYTVVEKSPEFPGGYEGLLQYLAATIQYPEEARADGAEGTVYVTFVIEPDGSTSGVCVLRSPHPALSQEAVRAVKAMPKWKAGRQRGKKVRVQYTLPVNFQLQ